MYLPIKLALCLANAFKDLLCWHNRLGPIYTWPLLPGSSSPVVIGGKDHSTKGNASTEDIKMYDKSNHVWKPIELLSNPKS